jgi:multidrug efflux pump subunit AcrB
VGCASPRFQLTYEPQIGGKNFAQLIVNTKSIKTTLEMLNEYAPRLSNHWPGAYVRFKQMDYLSVPTYEYRFYGSDIDSIELAAERLMERMRQMPELEWVHTDFDQPTPVMDVTLDPVTSSQLGISRTAAELQLAMQSGKVQWASIWEGNYEVPVVLRDKETEHMKVSDVENLYLTDIDSVMEIGLYNEYKMYENFKIVLDANYLAVFLSNDSSTWKRTPMNGTSRDVRDAWNVNLSFAYEF